MPALTTTDEFLELLRKSELVDGARLNALQTNPPVTLPTKPRALAELLIRQGFLTAFQAGQLLSGKWRGFQVANKKYKLLELLGVGGMGKVYLCEHIRMKRLVALKVLPTNKLEEKSSLERFEREARAAAALDHPNIVRAHDLDQDGKLHFLVMEFVDGNSLQEIVKKFGPMDVVRASHYIAQAAEGLQHAHEAGWVHRDIKPGNLLLDRSGTIKILDMGLARFFHDDGGNAITQKYEKTAVLGTADYLAPEQAVNSSEVDIRADIYSLGATFYYLLTGKGPFDHGTINEKLIWHQMRTPEPIRSLRPEVPKELEAVINKMMAKKPVHRYQEPAGVVEALRPWTSQPIEPPADEEMPRLCPALEAYTLSGTSLPASNSPLSSPRLRGRVGPRTGSHPRVPMSRVSLDVSRRRKPLLIAGAVGGVTLLALVAGLIYWWTSGDTGPIRKDGTGPRVADKSAKTTPKVPDADTPPPAPVVVDALPPASPDKLFVTASPKFTAAKRADVLPTLTAAVAKAKPGQTVLVLDPQIEEQVEIDGARLTGLRLESGLPGGVAVTWRAPAEASPGRPLLKLVNPTAVQVKGFVFDGGRKLDTLVFASGNSRALRLEELHLTEAMKQSLILADCASPQDQPITIERVRFTTTRDYSLGDNKTKEENAGTTRPAAIDCTTASGGGVHLAIRHCRIEGNFKAGLKFDGPSEVEVRLCRFYTLKDDTRPVDAAVADAVFVKTPASGAVKLTFASNTVARFPNMIRFDKLPAPDSGSSFALRSNLMIGGDAFVSAGGSPDAAKVQPMFAPSAGNVARPKHCNRGVAVVEKTTVDFGYIDVNVASDGFLRYKRSGDTLPLYTSGAGGEPVGVPPLE